MTFLREDLSDDVTVYLGDCREILPTLGRFDAVVTDPPYGMKFRSNHRSVRHSEIAFDGEAWPLEFAASIEAMHSRYVFCRWDDLRRIQPPRSCVTWVKNNWSMGDLQHEHARQTEIIMFWPGPAHFFPSGRPADVIEAARTGNDNHPTEKPVTLMERIVGWTDGTVIDPFMGSGTTGVACVRLDRRFVGIEIDRVYFDTARRRLSAELAKPRLPLDDPPPRATQEALL